MQPMIMGVGAITGLTIAIAVMGMYRAAVYTCPLCGAEFTSEQALIDHFETEHPTEPIDIIWE